MSQRHIPVAMKNAAHAVPDLITKRSSQNTDLLIAQDTDLQWWE